MKISFPVSVIAIECSNCADSDLSRVTAVQPSPSTLAQGLPRLIIGSMVKNIPAFSLISVWAKEIWIASDIFQHLFRVSANEFQGCFEDFQAKISCCLGRTVGYVCLQPARESMAWCTWFKIIVVLNLLEVLAQSATTNPVSTLCQSLQLNEY